jgi:hypothetical protein
MAEEIRHKTVRIIKNSSKPKDNLSISETRGLKSLCRDLELTFLPADEGNATVIVSTEDYIQKNPYMNITRRPSLQKAHQGSHKHSGMQDRCSTQEIPFQVIYRLDYAPWAHDRLDYMGT